MVRLHCFSQSGNSYKVALALNVLRQPWEPVFVDFMNGATRTPRWREEFNALGEVPILEDGPLRLTQSGAILTHLAAKHLALGGTDQAERLEVLRWLLFDNHKFTSYLASYRFMKSFAPSPPDPAVAAWLKGRIDGAFAIVDQHLSGRDFMVGGAPTIADLSMCGYLFYPEQESGCGLIERHAHIARWLDRIRGLEGWGDPYDILPGARMAPRW